MASVTTVLALPAFGIVCDLPVEQTTARRHRTIAAAAVLQGLFISLFRFAPGCKGTPRGCPRASRGQGQALPLQPI